MIYNVRYWFAGWYATKLHAVPASRVEGVKTMDNFQSMCGAWVYSQPRTEWAAQRLSKGLPQCKHCLRLCAKEEAGK